MNFISLFAGIGGLDLGLERAGMNCVAQVEIDDFCQKVLTKHWPDVPKFKDVRNVGKHNLPAADLICGGFPCQPHSYAGKRKGKDDDRNLWPEYLRIIRETKPEYVLGENVPGIITTILDQVLSDLENIGYTCQTFIIPACAVGANHRRNRVFVLAYSNSIRCLHGQPEIVPGERGIDAQCESVAGSEDVADTNDAGLSPCWEQEGIPETQGKTRSGIERGSMLGREWNTNWWNAEPAVGRVANGVPRRVDRLKSLGNAVVPQVAEFIGRCILDADALA